MFGKRFRKKIVSPGTGYSCRASVTVEASLVFPIFLCAVACFIGLAQMILVETEVHYAVSQTAKICAKQQMFSLIPEEDDQKSNQVKEDNGIHKSDRTNGRQSIRNASSVFFDIYDVKSLCDSSSYSISEGYCCKKKSIFRLCKTSKRL